MVQLKVDTTETSVIGSDFYLGVRVGDSQKFSKVSSSYKFKFPASAAGTRRYGKVELFKRLGTCSISIDKGYEDSIQEITLPGDIKFKIELSDGIEPVKNAAAKAEKSASEAAKAKAAKDYLESHHLELRLAEAMRAVLKERPADPGAFFAQRITESANMVTAKPTKEGDAAAVSVPQACTGEAAAVPVPQASAGDAAKLLRDAKELVQQVCQKAAKSLDIAPVQSGATQQVQCTAGLYAINGFYMSMRDCYTTPGASIHYFDVEWDPAKSSWANFRQVILGATDPEASAPGSLRGQIKSRWQELGLPGVPSVRDNGVHASASPLEAMAERANWLGDGIDQDPLGKALAAAGVPVATQREWCQDPQVTLDGKSGSLFDTLEDMDVGPLLGRAAQIMGAAPPSDAAKAACPQNRALAFVKPHAFGDKAVALVRERLAAEGMTVLRDGVIGHKKIDEEKLIDKHYGAIASKASLLTPDQLNPSTKAVEAFGTTFGLPWADALASGQVLNAVDACKKLNINGTEMATLWNDAKTRGELVKFGGGFYCARVSSAPRAPEFVLNAVYCELDAAKLLRDAKEVVQKVVRSAGLLNDAKEVVRQAVQKVPQAFAAEATETVKSMLEKKGLPYLGDSLAPALSKGAPQVPAIDLDLGADRGLVQRSREIVQEVVQKMALLNDTKEIVQQVLKATKSLDAAPGGKSAAAQPQTAAEIVAAVLRTACAAVPI